MNLPVFKTRAMENSQTALRPFIYYYYVYLLHVVKTIGYEFVYYLFSTSQKILGIEYVDGIIHFINRCDHRFF